MTDFPSSDLFQTEAWFELLLAHGFERTPHALHVLRLPALSGDAVAQLHLIQQNPGACLAALSNYYSCLYGPTNSDSNAYPVLTSARANQVETSGLSIHGNMEQPMTQRVESTERTSQFPAVQMASGVNWMAAARALQQLPGSWVIRLQPLDADAAWVAALETGLHSAGYRTTRYFAFGNWYQPVCTGGFGAYWLKRPSALRNSVERGRRRLDKAGCWQIDLVTEPGAELHDALAAYQMVYANSWKAPEPCPQFIPGLVQLAAQRGWLRLGVLRLNGEPLAAQLWLTCGRKAHIYKLAYVKGVEKLSAGSVLTQAMMQHAMDVDHVTEVDYLSGDDAYKADWMALRRERVGLEAFDLHRLQGFLTASRQFGAVWWRRFKKN